MTTKTITITVDDADLHALFMAQCAYLHAVLDTKDNELWQFRMDNHDRLRALRLRIEAEV